MSGGRDLGLGNPDLDVGEIQVKKIAAALLFLVAAAAGAQTNVWTQWGTGWQLWNGGPPVSAGYLILKDETTPLASRSILSMLGAGVTCVDNAGNAATECTIPGGGGGLADPGGNGMLSRTALNTTAARTLVCAAAYCTWANGDGVAGAPSLTLVPFVASGGSHATGIVPDPGATAGNDRLLKEDATFSNPFTDPQLFIVREDFLEMGNGSTVNPFSSGAGAGVNRIDGDGTSDSAHPGIYQLDAGTTSTGVASVQAAPTQDAQRIAGAGGAFTFIAAVKVPTLSDGTDTYVFRIGLCDVSTAGNDCTDGVYFEYSQATDTHWRIKTAKATTRTATNTTNTVTAGQWDTLKILCNAGWTSCNFFVNGTETSGSPISTNIPGTANATGIQVNLQKTVGTTSRGVQIDYLLFFQRLTTTR